jgi:hypothetical protein
MMLMMIIGGQSAVCGILEKGFGLHCLRLNIPMSTIGESTPEEVKQEGAARRKKVCKQPTLSHRAYIFCDQK